MKLFALTAGLLLCFSGTPDMELVREMYLKATASEEGVEAFVTELERAEVGKNPLLLGYLGTAHTMHAQYAFNPYTKYQRFATGKNQLEAAISADPNNAELRFLRLTVQEHAPSFLGYNNALEEDKTAILNFLTETHGNTGIFVMMRTYMLGSTVCTDAEKEQLSAAVSNTQ